MRTFTVIGFYPASGQRFVSSLDAETASAAEDECEASHPGLVVCGVIEGDHQAADTDRSLISE